MEWWGGSAWGKAPHAPPAAFAAVAASARDAGDPAAVTAAVASVAVASVAVASVAVASAAVASEAFASCCPAASPPLPPASSAAAAGCPTPMLTPPWPLPVSLPHVSPSANKLAPCAGSRHRPARRIASLSAKTPALADQSRQTPASKAAPLVSAPAAAAACVVA
eukprot:73255-Chlamydomonas_euryale.AAC.2